MNTVRVRVLSAVQWPMKGACHDATGGMVWDVDVHGDEGWWVMDSAMEATE